MQFGADPTGDGQVADITGETVAEVDHGMDGELFGEPMSLIEPGLEFEVMARDGSPEFSGDEESVARLGAGSTDGSAFVDGPECGDGNEDAFWIGGRFASDDGDIPAASGFAETVV